MHLKSIVGCMMVKKKLERDLKIFMSKISIKYLQNFLFSVVLLEIVEEYALICENLTEERWKLNLHAVEIKVSKSDLINDHKYTEYADFTDYIWLAIPEELVADAKETKLDKCGILVIKDNKVQVIEQAQRLDAIRREEWLSRLALKLL